MKKLLILSLLLNSAIAKAMLITLPAADVLKERLCAQGLNHFVQKTKIHQVLNGKQLFPLDVGVAVELAMSDYAEYIKHPVIVRQMQLRKREIIKTILQDYPVAIAQLEKEGVLE